ncbi:sugar phosphate isomerase/epimerase family protein [Puniceicoccus vermicola]|uniref:Sugar phosphate isomerase/epimerase n=1 Tax=Puniceicoccus vermicola TaxID=388746 RepID=A0A7X1E646_9BACT|nr:sugar phosphate isomerase/epimerase [Puniceicoccus vermicola]MBC2603738.1 sugar phosphate isomerase/epimerase [Puniceicoccus vermicola]
MNVQLFKTLWGHSGPYATAADQVVAAGFQGFEGPIPAGGPERAEFLEALSSRDLLYIGEISTTGFAVPDPGSTVEDHLEAFERILESSLEAKPIYFSSMAGNDLWSFAETIDFFTKAWEIAQKFQVRVGFETHRSRSLYHPIVTKNLLAELPPIELTLDISHWCNVCERLVLDELPEVLELISERALHIQPRIGYDQGAQVPDPRAPLYQPAVEAHIRWWKSVWKSQKERGFERITMTPEFGPDGYLQVDPYTEKPVADLWELNQWAGHRMKEECLAFLGE